MNLIDDNNFACNICKTKYKSYQSFWNHNKIKHPDKYIQISNKVKKFSCDKCNKKFTRNNYLKIHLLDSCKNKPLNIIIPNENKIVENKIKIVDNEIVNSENNTKTNIFSCVICTKKYKSYQSFWNHNKINHSTEHIQISNKVKNFSCTKCNKKFTRKSNLQSHMETSCKKKEVVDKTTLLEKELNELKNKFNIINSLNEENIELKNKINILMKR